jgi:uncharacterized membrane protein
MKKLYRSGRLVAEKCIFLVSILNVCSGIPVPRWWKRAWSALNPPGVTIMLSFAAAFNATKAIARRESIADLRRTLTGDQNSEKCCHHLRVEYHFPGA